MKVLARDWIGLEVEVVKSPNECEEGIKGLVVDETMNTFRIRTNRGVKTVAKKDRVFCVRIDDEKYKVNGDLTAFRPEERIMRGIMIAKRIKR